MRGRAERTTPATDSSGSIISSTRIGSSRLRSCSADSTPKASKYGKSHRPTLEAGTYRRSVDFSTLSYIGRFTKSAADCQEERGFGRWIWIAKTNNHRRQRSNTANMRSRRTLSSLPDRATFLFSLFVLAKMAGFGEKSKILLRIQLNFSMWPGQATDVILWLAVILLIIALCFPDIAHS